MFPRIATTMWLAALITFGLFWTMQALIGVTGELKEGSRPPSVEFVRLKRDNQPELKEREPPKREKPEQPPPPPQMNLAKSMNPDQAIAGIDPMLDSSLELEEATTLGAGGDRGVVPLVQIEPQYPPRAKTRGIEGWVEVRFTINAAGMVKDAVVIKSKPGTVFNHAALQAIAKWKFTPKMERGAAVERHGVMQRFTFHIED